MEDTKRELERLFSIFKEQPTTSNLNNLVYACNILINKTIKDKSDKQVLIDTLQGKDRTTSKLGKELIKHFEGDRLKAYVCPAGYLTVGVGHLIAKGDKGILKGKPIKEGDLITQQLSDELLSEDLNKFERAVSSLVKVDLNQNQFDALVAFTFNVGEGALKQSTLLKLLNQKNYQSVPEQLLRWNKAGGKELAGLTRRRKSEGVLFSQGKLQFNF